MLKKIFLIVVLNLFFVNNIFAYFEYKYQCAVNTNNISVSLNKKPNYRKCMDLIKEINKKIFDIDDNINIAQKYINDKEDPEYWLWVKWDLTKNKKDLEFLKIKINWSMNLFENGLFVKIKKLLNYYLAKELFVVNTNITIINNKVNESQKISDAERMKENIKSLDERIIKKYILNWILEAENFDQLIPLLKNRLKLYKKI